MTTTRVRASCSVPGIVVPVEIGGRLLSDGGVINNLPISVVRELGADIVIAVDISAPMLEREQLTSVISVTEQLTNFLTRRSTDAQIASLGEDDILIVPELDEFASTDFTRVMEILDRGYQAARLQRDGLARLMGEARDSAEDAPAPAPEATQKASAMGSAPATSASPPVFTSGAHSEVTESAGRMDDVYSMIAVKRSGVRAGPRGPLRLTSLPRAGRASAG